MEQLTLFPEELHASPSQSLDSEKDWMIRVATWRYPILDLLTQSSPSGSFGKMCPEFCQVMEDGTLLPLSQRYKKSGMGGHTESLTLNTLESPNVVVESFLSDIIEDGNVPQRYFLTPKACSGILRRIKDRNAKIPNEIILALEEGLQQKPSHHS